MKNSFLLIVILSILSCNDKKIKNITCESQREEAKNDFDNNRFTYFEHIELFNDNINRANFTKFLEEHNIKVIFDTLEPVGCIPESETDPQHNDCYKEMMNNNLHAKFGNPFFDSLRLKSNYNFQETD